MLWQVRAGCRGSATAWRCWVGGVDTCSHVQYCSREPPLSAPCGWRHRDPVLLPLAWLIAQRPSGLLTWRWSAAVEYQSRWIRFSRHWVSADLSSSRIRFSIRRPTDDKDIFFHFNTIIRRNKLEWTIESRRSETFNCSGCFYSIKRSYNLKPHILNKHTTDRKTVAPIKSSNAVRNLGNDVNQE